MSNPAALISVANKEGIEQLGLGLEFHGYEIFATEKTAEAMPHVSVAGGYEDLLGDIGEYTPLSGKGVREQQATQIAATILGQHRAPEDYVGAPPIEVVCINLPQEPDPEKPDHGGPTLLSAGILAGLLVLSHPEQYEEALDRIAVGCHREEDYLQRLASDADRLIARHHLLLAMRREKHGAANAPAPVTPIDLGSPNR